MSLEITNKYSERANDMNPPKWLWGIPDRKPPRESSAPAVSTDIYSVPPTSRRIPWRPQPMK
jgi:hypothetical protein